MRDLDPDMSPAVANLIAATIGEESDRRTLRKTAEKEQHLGAQLADISPEERRAIVGKLDNAFEHGPLAAVSIDDVVPISVARLTEVQACFGPRVALAEAFLALVNPTTYNYEGYFAGSRVGIRRVNQFEGIPYRTWRNDLKPLLQTE